MSSRRNDKARLRRDYLEARKALDRPAWQRMSGAIADRLERLAPFAGCTTVLTYVSARDNEVDTHTIIDRALAAGKTVLVPVMSEQPGLMRWSLLQGRSELATARFGLLEPAPAYQRLIEAPDEAVCLVPGIVFTRDGRRIGYGGGYFDRFLASFAGIAVGLAFNIQLAPTLPVESHDMQVTYILTESACYRAADGVVMHGV